MVGWAFGCTGTRTLVGQGNENVSVESENHGSSQVLPGDDFLASTVSKPQLGIKSEASGINPGVSVKVWTGG